MGYLANLARAVWPSKVNSLEGQYRDGPYYLPVSGGWLSRSEGQNINFWQMGFDPHGTNHTAMVEACVAAYAQTIAMCPGDHWLQNDKGGRKRVTTSDLSRILRTPNDYQSISDFLMNLVRWLYLNGNAYAVALRNNRYEISELHLMNADMCHPRIAETGEIFYSVGGNEILERRLFSETKQFMVPQRDVVHVRLNTPRHPLIGESPIRAAAIDMATSNAMSAQQLQFYLNQSRPSVVLQTDQKMTRETIDLIREKWYEQSSGMNQGGTPILSSGIKPIPLNISAQDSQLAEIMQLSNQNIALAFRVPLQILGIGGPTNKSGGTATESLMQHWISQGLGFALNHIEEALGQAFSLFGQPLEYVELSTAVLLRSSIKDRISALAQGVQGGIYAPNEARAVEELPAVEYGDEPRVQQQVVPLSAAAAIPSTPPAEGQPPAPSNPDTPAGDPGKNFNDELIIASIQSGYSDTAKQLAI